MNFASAAYFVLNPESQLHGAELTEGPLPVQRVILLRADGPVRTVEDVEGLGDQVE
jgi:hypothetical protein